MKRTLLLLMLLLLPGLAYCLAVSPLRGHVNDDAALLSPAKSVELEKQLTDFERQESTQIVVLTIPTLAGENLEEFSIKVAEAWKIGQKGLDNGAILLIAKQERKIRIEVGRGLEGKLTDLVSGRIIRGIISPKFKQGDFEGGITAGTSAIMAAVRGEFQVAPDDGERTGKGAPPLLTLLLFLMVACVFLGAISRILGGLAGAAGVPMIAAPEFSQPRTADTDCARHPRLYRGTISDHSVWMGGERAGAPPRVRFSEAVSGVAWEGGLSAEVEADFPVAVGPLAGVGLPATGKRNCRPGNDPCAASEPMIFSARKTG